MRNGWSVNLRAIENCIFSIRSIERNMRPILWTVYATTVCPVSYSSLTKGVMHVSAISQVRLHGVLGPTSMYETFLVFALHLFAQYTQLTRIT
jgi:hypothetical protein